MATILNVRATCDGWDVRILTANEAHMLHFVTQPTDEERDDVIAEFEKRMLDARVAEHNVEEIV